MIMPLNLTVNTRGGAGKKILGGPEACPSMRRHLGQITGIWDKLAENGTNYSGQTVATLILANLPLLKGHFLILWLANIAQCIFVGLSDALNITELSSRKMEKP